MLNSIYSRIFYLCTVVLLFACSLSGLIVMSYANRMHKKEAEEQVSTTAKVLTTMLAENIQKDPLPAKELEKQMSDFSKIENVDCYIFDEKGKCLVRGDSNVTEIPLSPAVRRKALSEPY